MIWGMSEGNVSALSEKNSTSYSLLIFITYHGILCASLNMLALSINMCLTSWGLCIAPRTLQGYMYVTLLYEDEAAADKPGCLVHVSQ